MIIENGFHKACNCIVIYLSKDFKLVYLNLLKPPIATESFYSYVIDHTNSVVTNSCYSGLTIITTGTYNFNFCYVIYYDRQLAMMAVVTVK